MYPSIRTRQPRRIHVASVVIAAITAAVFCSQLKAEVLTYAFSGYLTAGATYFGNESEIVTGTFTYDSSLPYDSGAPNGDGTGWSIYQDYSFTPAITFNFPAFSLQSSTTNPTKTHLTVYNNRGPTPTSTPLDMLLIVGSYFEASGNTTFPPSYVLFIEFRDSTQTVFDSMALPNEVPPLSAFDRVAIMNSSGVPIAMITDVQLIPEPATVALLFGCTLLIANNRNTRSI